MKTLSYNGGSIRLTDALADSVLQYSLALANGHRTASVTLDDGDADWPARTVVTIGMGIPLAFHISGARHLPAPDDSDRLDEQARHLVRASVAEPMSPADTLDFDEIGLDSFS